MKTQIRPYKVSVRLKAGPVEITIIESVLRRAIKDGFRKRNKSWAWAGFNRNNIRDAIQAYRIVRGGKMEVKLNEQEEVNVY